jgi:hypothetical protein
LFKSVELLLEVLDFVISASDLPTLIVHLLFSLVKGCPEVAKDIIVYLVGGL